MNRLAPASRASGARPRCSSAPTCSGTAPPRWSRPPAAAGRPAARSDPRSFRSPSRTQAAARSRSKPRPPNPAPPAATACSRRTARQAAQAPPPGLRSAPGQHRQVPRQRTQRPAVAGDVMQQQKQDVLLWPARREPSPAASSNRCARSGSSTDRSSRARPPRPAPPAGPPPSPPRPRAAAAPRRIQDRLPRHTEPVREHRPQALVALDGSQVPPPAPHGQPARQAAPQAGSHKSSASLGRRLPPAGPSALSSRSRNHSRRCA